MIIFKCKMCGGDLEIGEQMAVGTCRHCGSTMTLPKAADERIAALYHLTSRGNACNDIYRDDHDRQNYLSILFEVVKKYNWRGIHCATVSRAVRKIGHEM